MWGDAEVGGVQGPRKREGGGGGGLGQLRAQPRHSLAENGVLAGGVIGIVLSGGSVVALTPVAGRWVGGEGLPGTP